MITEELPFSLAYLPNGKPGIAFATNEESGLLASFKCSFAGQVTVKGSGVLGRIAEPELGEASSTLAVELNAPEGVQEYGETLDGTSYGLEASFNGGAFEPAGLAAEPGLALSEGEAELVGQPQLVPPGGDFPEAFTVAGEGELKLTAGASFVSCTSEGEQAAIGGSGEFESTTAGSLGLTLHNCHTTLGIKCTTPGQESGVVITEQLPFRLASLPDGEPGMAFATNEESGLLASFKCSFAGQVTVKGSGVLGRIAEPELGEASSTLAVELNAPEGVQEYGETLDGTSYGLEASFNGGEYKQAGLAAEPGLGFGEGEAELVE